MAKVSKSILEGYNKCAALATKWKNILDSVWHKDEKIPASSIDGIDDKLDKNEPAYFKIVDLGDVSGVVKLDLGLAVKFKLHWVGSGNITFSKLAEYEAKKSQSIVISSDDPNFMTNLPLGVNPDKTKGDELDFDLPTTKNHILVEILDSSSPNLLWSNEVVKAQV